MAIDTDHLDADLTAAIADLPLSFTYNGNAYTAAEDPEAELLDMADAGYADTRSKRLIVQISQFTANAETVPGPNAQITIDAETWNILSTTPHADRNAETWLITINT
jgi:hypothetical protein